MISRKSLTHKLVGEILEEADLINPGQIQVALMEQSIYTHLRLGEIFVLHNWLKPETADFFGEEIKRIINETQKKQIGYYLLKAGLLDEQEIRAILWEQKQLGVKFGALAVLKGFIKQKTLTFFLDYFTPDIDRTTDFQYRDKTTINSKRETLNQKTLTSSSDTSHTLSETPTYKKTFTSYEELIEEGLDDIPWVN